MRPCELRVSRDAGAQQRASKRVTHIFIASPKQILDSVEREGGDDARRRIRGRAGECDAYSLRGRRSADSPRQYRAHRALQDEGQMGLHTSFQSASMASDRCSDPACSGSDDGDGGEVDVSFPVLEVARSA